VFITVGVTDASAQPVSRAAVHLEIVTASGVTVVQDGSTNRSGLVTFGYLPEAAHGEGTYSANATAAVSGLSGSATAQFTVVAIAANCEICSFGEQVALTLTVFSEGRPLENAGVAVEITTPSGIVLSGGAITGSDGAVTLSFTPVRSFGAGAYLVEASGRSPWYTFSYDNTITVR